MVRALLCFRRRVMRTQAVFVSAVFASPLRLAEDAVRREKCSARLGRRRVVTCQISIEVVAAAGRIHLCVALRTSAAWHIYFDA